MELIDFQWRFLSELALYSQYIFIYIYREREAKEESAILEMAGKKAS